MINFAIIDDNKKILKSLSHKLESIFINYELDAQVSFTTTNANNLISYFRENKVDVLFLDIDLKSSLTGLELAEHIRKFNKNCYFIFSTAHFEYVSIAYKYKTFDFLSKPVNIERLEESILRLFSDIKGNPKKFIRLDTKNIIIDEDEIDYIKRDGMKIIFHTPNRDYEIYSSFSKIQDNLPNNFIRCHKSYIANTNNIIKITDDDTMYLKNSTCSIGPKYKDNLMEIINDYGISK